MAEILVIWFNVAFQSDQRFIVPLVIVAWLIVFPLFWMFVVFVIGFMSGWQRLANYYRLTRPFNGKTWSWQSGRLNFGNYSSTLITGADFEGLYLATVIFFRVGHPPLFIPWHDIEITKKQRLFYSVVEFQFAKVPRVKLRLPKRTAERILAARNNGLNDEFNTSI